MDLAAVDLCLDVLVVLHAGDCGMRREAGEALQQLGVAPGAGGVAGVAGVRRFDGNVVGVPGCVFGDHYQVGADEALAVAAAYVGVPLRADQLAQLLPGQRVFEREAQLLGNLSEQDTDHVAGGVAF